MQQLKQALLDKPTLATLLIILFFGSALRLYGLDIQSLWHDELATWQISSQKEITDVIKSASTDKHSLAYYVFLFFVEKYIGDSEVILRLPSALAGILSIFMMFALGTRFYSRKEGLIAAALVAFAWLPIFYSQEARAYSMLLLFAMISTYCWFVLLQQLQNNKLKPRYLIISAYVVSAIIACYLHYFGLLLIALQGLAATIFFLKKRKQLLVILAIYSAIVLAYSPWLWILWNDLHLTSFWIKEPTYKAFHTFIRSCFSSYKVFCLAIFLYFYYAARLMSNFRSITKDKFSLLNSTFLLILWIVVPLVVVYLKSITSTPVFLSKYLIILSPAVYLLLARSITTLPSIKPIFKNTLVIGIIAVLLFSNIFTNGYYSKPHKQQFREVVAYTVENDKPEYNSLIAGYSYKGKLNYYFNKQSSLSKINVMVRRKEHFLRLSTMLAEKDSQYWWFIVAHDILDAEFMAFLNSKFDLLEHKKFKGASVRLFKKPN